METRAVIIIIIGALGIMVVVGLSYCIRYLCKERNRRTQTLSASPTTTSRRRLDRPPSYNTAANVIPRADRRDRHPEEVMGRLQSPYSVTNPNAVAAYATANAGVNGNGNDNVNVNVAVVDEGSLPPPSYSSLFPMDGKHNDGFEYKVLAVV